MMAPPAAGYRARSIGLAAQEFVSWDTAEGTAPQQAPVTVVGCFKSGFYLRAGPVRSSVPNGVRSEVRFCAVVDPTIAPGPLHLQLDGPVPRVTVGSVAEVSPTEIVLGTTRIHLAGGAVFAGHPAPLDDAAMARLAFMPISVPRALLSVWPTLPAGLSAIELAGHQELLAGRGIGLTPDGDDVLAGIFLVLACDPASHATNRSLARTAPTTDLSRAFLRWASVGQAVKPIHQLLDAARTGDVGALRRAFVAIESMGHSSGGATLAGLSRAASILGPTRHQLPLTAS